MRISILVNFVYIMNLSNYPLEVQFKNMYNMDLRGVAQFGRALRSGRRSRVFESRHPDFFVSYAFLTLIHTFRLI